MLTAQEAADRLEVQPDHVRYLARVGRLRSSRDTGSLLVEEESVDSYRQSRGYWNPGQVRGGKRAVERQQLGGAVVIRKGDRHGAG